MPGRTPGHRRVRQECARSVGAVDDTGTPMVGKVVAVTGANAGIGKETAVALARMGATVVMTSRDAGRGAAALEDVRDRSGSTNVELLALDLAQLESVRSFATELLDRYDRLDVLVDNAGLVMSKRTETAEGFETTFGVNHLGHFYLTNLVLDRLRASAPARIVVLASHAHKMARRGLSFDDLQSTHRYRAFDAYSKSKLANVYFTRELARRLAGSGVTVNAAHPGYVASRFGRDGDMYLEPLLRLGAKLLAVTSEEGARTSVYLASSPEVEGKTGGYYVKCKPAAVSKRAQDDAAARRLWDVSEALLASALES
jgi:NAD(P)-dependent dehydrogenase (short-subunit alcohol dehydrogenase family)